MFEKLDILPPDPILGLSQEFSQSDHPNKVNLAVGVYKTETGNTPIFRAVKNAEKQMLEAQESKVYIAQQGDANYISGMTELLLGKDLMTNLGDRAALIMTPGGCGALRLGAETIIAAKSDATIWFSTPTWGNHYPLLTSAGLAAKEYPYYDKEAGKVDFDNMLNTLKQIPAGDFVLLHACCHNPTGADLTKEQWQQVVDVAEDQGWIPFIDIAYQGFGVSLDEDAYGLRLAAETLPEVVIASSCSKNFGLYRERTGATLIISRNSEESKASLTNAISLMRKNYSMSPFHGGGIVGTILSDDALKADWEAEVAEICAHVKSIRQQFADLLNAKQSVKDFTFITENQGMFSYLGITLEQVRQLRSEYGIYFLDSTRVNVAGLSSANIDYTTDSIAAVLNQG